ncbi:MAG: hypothetical protein COW88_02100 [Candidatus Lloydbacteria bacterium CG22_combo_CG10-13_8_21_14_all_47_15]|uniref:Trigger factor n=1 Tax=Candidatus Lloydbacteria bacterium CG22_combo_CG10-13_8_21_14_all_47_15 TaxID=1974635 RepID=A0A2H0CUJ6_9BACT|nr:MAG: hypothetical protein COW88_02100 [Candidatus Lloydbacteria bacterium CG22_combo_CG10-13_8_21_14_all_47_15]
MPDIEVQIKTLDGSQVEITGEIPVADFETERASALKTFGERADIPGFRKGHVPDDIISKHIGESAILHEMAEYALKKAYPDILIKNKIDALGEPKITLTKLATGNPLGFKILTSVMPKIVLPDYKKIAAGIPKPEKEEATDEEVKNVIDEVRKARATDKASGKKQEQETDATRANKSGILDAEGKPIQKKEPELPELTDEFAQSLGDFKSVSDLEAKIKENLTHEKEYRARDKRRAEIAEKILAESDFAVPDPFVKSETVKMLGRLKDDVARAGVEWSAYLTQANKTEDALAKDMRPEAEKRAKLQLLIHEIAAKEHITPDKEILEHEIKHIMEMHPDADISAVNAYVASILTNEAIFKFLET